jgi:phosphopantetheine adenylyltransferase
MELEKIEKDIKQLKARHDSLKEFLSIEEGKKQSLLSRLKEDFGINSVEEAKKRKIQIERKINEAASSIDKIKAEIEEKLSNIEI